MVAYMLSQCEKKNTQTGKMSRKMNRDIYIEIDDKKERSSRKTGIEALRIIAILMVIYVHRVGHETLFSAQQFSVSYYVLWFFEIVSYKAVDIFFIITGYFSVTQKKLRIKKIIGMEIKVALYIMFFFILGVSLGLQTFSGRELLKGFFPYVGGAYWYYTAYVSLILLSPWINKFLSIITSKQHLMLILLITLGSTLSLGDVFFTSDGYSVIWAINLYMIGAYIRLHIKKLPSVKSSILISAGSTGFIFMWFVAVGRLTQIIFGREIFSTHFLVYRQLPVVVGAIFTVIAFLQIDIKGIAGKIIRQIAGCVFGIYLIHSCVFMDVLFWVRLFPASNFALNGWYWLYVLGTVFVMFFVCLVIELIRNRVFRKLDNARWMGDLADFIKKKVLNFVVNLHQRIGGE